MAGVAARLYSVVHCLLRRDHNGSAQRQQGRASACLHLRTEAVHQRPHKSTCLVKLADELVRHHDVVAVV